MHRFGYFPRRSLLSHIFNPYDSYIEFKWGWDNLLKRAHVNEAFSHLSLSGDESVLEVGASGLNFAGEMAKKAKDVTAFDHIKDYSNLLKARFYPRNLRAIEGDAELLPFDDASFDIVYISEVLTVLERPGICVQECYRVLKNGGKLVSVHGSDFDQFETVWNETDVGRQVKTASQLWGTPVEFLDFKKRFFDIHGTNEQFYINKEDRIRNLLTNCGFNLTKESFAINVETQKFYCRLMINEMKQTGIPVLGRGQVRYLPELMLLEKEYKFGGKPAGHTYFCTGTK